MAVISEAQADDSLDNFPAQSISHMDNDNIENHLHYGNQVSSRMERITSRKTVRRYTSSRTSHTENKTEGKIRQRDRMGI